MSEVRTSGSAELNSLVVLPHLRSILWRCGYAHRFLQSQKVEKKKLRCRNVGTRTTKILLNVGKKDFSFVFLLFRDKPHIVVLRLNFCVFRGKIYQPLWRLVRIMLFADHGLGVSTVNYYEVRTN